MLMSSPFKKNELFDQIMIALLQNFHRKYVVVSNAIRKFSEGFIKGNIIAYNRQTYISTAETVHQCSGYIESRFLVLRKKMMHPLGCAWFELTAQLLFTLLVFVLSHVDRFS